MKRFGLWASYFGLVILAIIQVYALMFVVALPALLHGPN